MSSGGQLLQVVAAFSPIESGRFTRGGDSQNVRPPLTIWRFASPSPDIENAIREAVQTYVGSMVWEIRYEGRNWVVQPAAVVEYGKAREFRTDVERSIAFGREHPLVAEEAFEDLTRLAEHVGEALLK